MKAVRTTVSFPPDQYEKLQAIAEANGLSVAWVVRQAVSELLEKLGEESGFSPFGNISMLGGRG